MSANKFSKIGSQFTVIIILATLLALADFGIIVVFLVITSFGGIF